MTKEEIIEWFATCHTEPVLAVHALRMVEACTLAEVPIFNILKSYSDMNRWVHIRIAEKAGIDFVCPLSVQVCDHIHPEWEEFGLEKGCYFAELGWNGDRPFRILRIDSDTSVETMAKWLMTHKSNLHYHVTP